MLVCPSAQVVEQASAYTQFAPNNTSGSVSVDVNAAEYTLRFVQLSGACRLDGNALTMDVYMRFVAIPGAAMADQQTAQASWFMVLLQDQGQGQPAKILSRQVYPQQVNLLRNGERQFITEQYTINMRDVNASSLSNLVLLGGYVIDDEQWDFHEINPFFFQ